MSQYNQINSTSGVTLRTTNYTWSQDSAGNNYISQVQAISDPGQSYAVTKQTQQTLDQYGNVTESKLFSYTNLSTAAKTYNNTYLTGTYYAQEYIYNRLLTSTVTDSNNNTLTLATNTYDGATLQDAPGVTQFDPGYALSQNRVYRGNLTQSVSFANTSSYTYDITGTAVTTTSNGHSASATNSASNNYAAPSQVTATNSLSTTFNWNQYLAPTSSTGPNGDTASTVYDPNTARPTSSTSPYGAVTTYTYANTAPQVTATVNGRWTQTYLDGLGRTYRVAAGYSNTTVSYTDTIYDTCGCTPIGKPYQVSMPYAPGGTPVYKVNTYDALGRTLTTVLPDGASTTSYSYQGNTVTVTDPAGKWKQYTVDAFGELTQVVEPSPNPGTEPNHVTTYAYDVLGHLIQASMPRTINGNVVTQTRTWTYSPTTQWLSSITQPETGTTSFTYNSDGTMATKTDAKSQQTQYTYDSYGDLIQVSRGTVSGGVFTEDVGQRVNYTYGAQGAQNNSAGRVTNIAYGPLISMSEGYRYTAPGQVSRKSLSVGGASSLNVSYTYDNEGRMLTITYPGSAQYTYGFDPMGRLNTMTTSGGSLASERCDLQRGESGSLHRRAFRKPDLQCEWAVRMGS